MISPTSYMNPFVGLASKTKQYSAKQSITPVEWIHKTNINQIEVLLAILSKEKWSEVVSWHQDLTDTMKYSTNSFKKIVLDLD